MLQGVLVTNDNKIRSAQDPKTKLECVGTREIISLPALNRRKKRYQCHFVLRYFLELFH